MGGAAGPARVLVGRDAEQAALGRWLERRLGLRAEPAGERAVPVTFVSGEAGLGKTALVDSVLAGMAHAFPVGDGPAGDPARHGAPPFIARGAGSQWQPAAFGALAPAVPGWDRTPEPAALRSALLAAAAGRPAVLFLDDLHWSDEASLELLAALAGAVSGDPVAVLGAYRGDELPPRHLLRRVRAALRHGRRLREVALGALAAADVSRLVAGLLGAEPAPGLVAVVADRTEGVPFFVEELIGALRDEGRLVPQGDRIALAPAPGLPVPDTVRDAVLLRAARLPDAARGALEAAAVLGVEFDVDTATVLAGLDAWPDQLDHCGLITVDGEGNGRFRHALAQEAVYADVPWSRRRALHFAQADRLTARHAAPLLVAGHLLAGHDFDGARHALVAAAADQMRVHGYRDAARVLRRALELWRAGVDEPGRLAATERLARCAELTGEHTEAVSLLRELVDAQPGGATQAAVHRRLALQHELLGQWPRALAAREAAAALFAAAGDPGEAAAERLAAAAHLRSAASFRASLDVLAAAHADAVHAGRPDLQVRAEGLRGNVLCRMGRPGEGLPAVRAALDLALSQGLSGPAAELYQRLADSLEHASDYRAASAAYDSAYEFCQAHGDDATGHLCQACATVVLFHTGRWDRAVRLCQEVLDAPAVRPHPRAVATGLLGLVFAMRGKPDPARAALLESRSVATRIGLVAMELLSGWGLALVEELSGNPEGATEEYRRVLLRGGQTEERHYCVPVLHFAAAYFAEHSRADLGAVTARLARIAEATGQPEARAALAYALGEAADDPEAALRQYRRACDLLTGLELPIVDSLIRWRIGRLLLEGGDADRAAECLRQAYRTLRRVGARPLADRVRSHLSEVDRRRPGTGAPLGLSAREAQVLGMVAEGHTSREIGQRLFLSTRTVEMHVQNAMTKLGCRTRAEAVNLLSRGSDT